jgi:hypothetical protein
MVIENLDPGEGLEVTQTLHAFCLSSKLLLQIARPQLYSLVRIDDMRNKLDMGLVKMHRMMKSMTHLTSGGPPLDWWMETVFRKTDYDVEKERWQERKAKKEQAKEKGGDATSGGNEDSEEEEVHTNYNYFRPRDVYDEEEEGYGRSGNGLPTIHPYDFGPTDILDPFSFTQLQSLEAFPHLGQHVKTINFYGRVEGKPTAFAIERFLKVCPNVETIILARGDVRFVGDWPSALDHIVKYAPNLKSLTILDHGERGSIEIFQSIEKLTKLKHLSLSCTPEDDGFHEFGSVYDPSTLPTSLTSFHLGSIATPGYYEELPTSFNQSITSLGVSVRRELPDITKFSNLQHLTIHFGLFCHAVEFLTTVSDSPTIKSLELCISDSIGRAEYQERRFNDESDEESDDGAAGGSSGKKKKKELDSMLDLFDNLPPNIETLSLLWILTGSPSKQLAEAVRTKLPTSLRKIRLLSDIGRKEEEEFPGFFSEGEDEEEDGKKSGTWLDKLSKLLDEKGVQLYRVPEEYGGHERSGIFRGITKGQAERAGVTNF